MNSGDAEVFFQEKIVGGPPVPEDYRRFFELLWESYGEGVFLYAYAELENLQDARDVCQDAFVNAMEWVQKNPGQLPAKVNFPAWLRRIARNLIIDRFRRPAVVREWPRSGRDAGEERDQYSDWPDMRTCGPVEEVNKKEAIEAVRHCIDLLPEPKRRVMIMRDIDGIPYAEIAGQVGMPTSTVGVLLHRARKELRNCVELLLAV